MTSDPPVVPFSPEELGETEYREPARRLPRDFHQWHRPRKQYVRTRQWLACVADIFEARDAEDIVKYIGLPGTDLLDLRLLYTGLCVPSRRRLRFLGFDSSALPGSPAGVNLEVSQQELKSLDLVHEQSHVWHDDFRAVASDQSRAFQEAKNAGPFDIGNIDLCSSVARDSPTATAPSLYDAVQSLLGIQVFNPHPWLLLVTTHVDREGINGEAAAALWRQFLRAAALCEGFDERIKGWIEPELLDKLTEDDCPPDAFYRAIAIGFCCWMAGLVKDRQWRTNVRTSFAYRQNPQSPCADMWSIAIRFTPVVAAPKDPVGLGTLGSDDPVDWCAQAVQAAERVTKTIDIDERLASDPALRSECVEGTASLLAQARYSETAYREWVADYAS